MNKQQKEWLDHYIQSGDALDAVRLAYPDVQPQSQATKASYLKKTLSVEIDKAARDNYAVLAPQMQNIIKDIALNKSGDVRAADQLKAASEILTRAKHDAPLQVDISDTRSHEQLLQQLKQQVDNVDDDTLKAAGLTREALQNLTGGTDDRTTH